MLNPSRIEFLKILKKWVAKSSKKKQGLVRLYNIEYIVKGMLSSSKSAYLIDEYPILSIAASQARGMTAMKGLNELRHKESDRIKSISNNFKKLEINFYLKNYDLFIFGKKIKIKNEVLIKTFNDHRIAMAFSILNILCGKKLKIDNKKCISISYPDFEKHLKQLL